ncbi:hypothetical protein BOX15_Mlig001165g7, partial [Macrostomum lignano]
KQQRKSKSSSQVQAKHSLELFFIFCRNFCAFLSANFLLSHSLCSLAGLPLCEGGGPPLPSNNPVTRRRTLIVTNGSLLKNAELTAQLSSPDLTFEDQRCYAVAKGISSSRRDRLMQLRDCSNSDSEASQGESSPDQLKALETRLEEVQTRMRQLEAISQERRDRRSSFAQGRELLSVAKQCYAERMKELANERKQTELLLEDARSSVQALEEQLEQLRQSPSPLDEADYHQSLKVIEKKLEAQQKVFEDLEFMDLEQQARADEEREQLFRQLVSHQAGLIAEFRSVAAESSADRAGGPDGENVDGATAGTDDAELQKLRAEREQLLDAIELERRRRLLTAQSADCGLAIDNGDEAVAADESSDSSRLGDFSQQGGLRQRQLSQGRAQSSSQFRSAGRPLQHALSEDSLPSGFSQGPSMKILSQLGEQVRQRRRAQSSVAKVGLQTPQVSDTYENASSSYELLLTSEADVTSSGGAMTVSEPAAAETGMLRSGRQFEQGGSGCSSGSRPDSAGHSYDGGNQEASTGATALKEEESGNSRKSRPLTHYLPVSDPNFDLRGHLIGLGHPLEGLHVQVGVATSRCYGYLAIPAGKFRPWKRRWFVLDRYRKTLAYYADSTEARVKSFISFCDIIDAYTDRFCCGSGGGGSSGSRKRQSDSTFCIGTVDKKRGIIRCLAPSPEAMRVWLDSVIISAEGYLLMLQDRRA